MLEQHGDEGVNDRDLQAGSMDQGFYGSRIGQDGEERLLTTHADQDGEEGLFGSQDLSDGDLANIGANYVHMA